MQSLKVLLIEDNDEHASIISRYLRRVPDVEITLVREALLQIGISRLDREDFDVLLLDLRLPDSDIEDTLRKRSLFMRDVPVVVLSTLEERDLAIRSVHLGAQDFLVKADLTSPLLVRAIFNAIERKQTELKLQAQMAQNIVLFQLCQRALRGESLDMTLNYFIPEIEKTLMIDSVVCLHLDDEMLAQVGMTPELLNSHEVEVIPSLRETLKYAANSILRGRGWASGLQVVIRDEHDEPNSLLLAFHHSLRQFTPDEISFFAAAGNILASVFIRKDLEGRVQSTVEKLKMANIRKDEFLSTLSHELRTPLNVINGNLELLLAAEKGSAEYNSAFEAIQRNLDIETKLVSDTLEMSRMVSGQMNLSFQEFDFDEMLQGLLKSLAPKARVKSVGVKAEVAEPIGMIQADPARLSQALWNILTNAIKFNVVGGEVIFRAVRVEDQLDIGVRDTGGGIEPENINNVFEGFWQEDASINRRYMGLGMGLAMARHIIELHGGVVKVKSEGKNQGAEFTISVPVRVQEQNIPISQKLPLREPVFQSINTLNSKKHNDILAGLHILLVDDSEDTLVLMKRLLERDGAQVTSCLSPFDGLDAAKENIFDLIISDIGMPDLDGYELMRQYRDWEKENRNIEIPAIALTAYVTEEDAHRAKSVGFQVHMSKPMNLKKLEATILELKSTYH